MKVVILGKDEMLANLIRGAMLADADIVGIFRYENLIYSKFKLLLHDFFKSSPDLTLIKKHKLNDIKLKSANSEEFRNLLVKLNADIVLVGTWKEKLSKETYNIPSVGTINVHPSLLPAYRGPNPYLQTIWHREKFSGITFHLMTENFDQGPILAQDKIEILEGDTGKELKNKTVFRARLLCARLLEKLKKGCVEPTDQDEEKASYFGNVRPEDMTLNFKKETAEEICAHVRAFHPFLPTYIQIENSFKIINPYQIKISALNGSPAEVLEQSETTITIACKDGKSVEFSGLKKYRGRIRD